MTAFVVKAVTSGTLLVGTTAGSASAWVAGTNDTIDATHQAYWTGAANANGTLNAFTVVARDDGGLESVSAPVQVPVTVNAMNDAPTATNLNTAETYTQNSALNLIDIVVSDVDSANVTVILTFSDVAAGSLNTGTSGSVLSNFAAGVWTASGALADVNSLLAALTFTPALNYNSNFAITTSVSDGVAAAITGSKAMTGIAVNDAPVALADTLAATEVTAVTYTAAQLSGNDTDVDNTNAQLSVASVASGAGGTAMLNGNGTVTFTPTLDFNGPASFSYTISDGTDTSLPAAVTVNVVAVNDASVANPDTLAATEDTPITYTATLSIASVTSGAGGTAILNADGTVTFTPNANFNGVANFSYTATDGTLVSNAASVTVNAAPVNDAPLTTPVTLAAIAEGSGARLITQAELLANATDVDGPATTAINLAISSGAGTLVDNGNGTWSYTPALHDDTAVTLSYSVTDGSLTVNGSATLDITPVSNAPVTLLAVSVVFQAQPSISPPSQNPASPAVTPPAADSKVTPIVDSAIGNGIASKPNLEAAAVAPETLIDNPSSQQSSPRIDGFAEGSSVRNAVFGQTVQLGAILIKLDGISTAVSLEQFKLAEAEITQRTMAATSSTAFTDELDRLRDNTKAEEVLERNIIVSSVATGAGLSVGYVLWLLRDGLLLTSLLSSLPAWRFVDPLPVLGRLKGDDEDDEDADGESLESIVRGGNEPVPMDEKEMRND